MQVKILKCLSDTATGDAACSRRENYRHCQKPRLQQPLCISLSRGSEHMLAGHPLPRSKGDRLQPAQDLRSRFLFSRYTLSLAPSPPQNPEIGRGSQVADFSNFASEARSARSARRSRRRAAREETAASRRRAAARPLHAPRRALGSSRLHESPHSSSAFRANLLTKKGREKPQAADCRRDQQSLRGRSKLDHDS